jgi:hypothetical protein
MVLENGSCFCQPVNIGRKDILPAIESAVCIAKVINQQKNDIGFFALGMGLRADAEQCHQKKLISLEQGR